MNSLFPAFRSRFIPEAGWSKDTRAQESMLQGPEDSSTEPLVRMAGCGPAAAVRGPANFIRPLMLDLNTLPREDGPPSESVLKRQKFAAFEKHCSKVHEGLYVSGEAVARDRTILAQHNISHVVNCVGALYPEYFKTDGIQYKTLWLQDHPQEDITCVLYDTFDFIEAARKGSSSAAGASGQQQPQQRQHSAGRVPPLPLQQQQQQRFLQQQQQQLVGADGGGRVLVHCSQGVSRSTTIAIAYLMWKLDGTYDEVYTTVRALRGVTSPNVGFMCQLINWAKRRQRSPTRVRLYRISPHCPDSPLYLVPKAVSARPGCSHPDWTQLDPRGCFVAHLHSKVYVWRGQHCMQSMLEAGVQAAAQLSRYERAPAAQVVRQGEEPADLLEALAPGGSHSSSSTCETSSCCTRADSAAASAEPSSNNLVGAPAAAGTACAAGAADPVQPAAAAACSAGWGSSQQQQEQQQLEADGDTEMTSAPPPDADPAQEHQQAEVFTSQQAAALSSQPLSSSQQQPINDQSTGPSAAAAAAAAAAAGSAPASDAAAAAAAAQVLLGVQLGLADGLKVLQQVSEYDKDFDMWFAALQCSSQPEGGRHTPRSPLTAAGGGAWEEGSGQSPKSGSPASLEGRNRKYSRSDSEGRSVVPTCRQPGRLSTSSSQAWPDSSAPSAPAAVAAAGPGSVSEGGGAYLAAAAEQAIVNQAAAAAGRLDGATDWQAAAGDGVEMRQSSTDESM